jgi:hypothetical protein
MGIRFARSRWAPTSWGTADLNDTNSWPELLNRGISYVQDKCMKPKPRRKLTITVEDAVYRGLRRVVGRRNISRFLNDLARPLVTDERLEEAYKSMAADEEREAEATQWSEGLVGEM